MTFFYDLNKRLDGIRATPETTHKQLNERDMSKSTSESAFQAAIGKKKYGDEGMKALQKAGRNHSSDKTMDAIRNRFDKYDESQGMADEGTAFTKAVIDAKRDGIQPGEKIQVGGKEMPLKEIGDTPAGLAAVQKVGQRADRAIGDAGTGYSGSELDNPDKTYAARDRANSIVGRERIRANDKNPTRVVGGPNHGNRMEEGGSPMTAKQKSFAALAEPKDKITFADKIAGAKKEVDEMLGDVAAEAMKKALGGGMGRSAEMEEKEDLSPFTNYKKPRADKPKVGSVERGALHDIEHTATGRKVTRRVDPNTGHSVGADDDTPATGEKRGKGRPKKAGGPNQERVTAKSRKTDRTAHGQEGFKKDKKVKESDEYGDEGDMAKDDLRSIAKAAAELNSLLNDHDDLPEWVQSKITKALDYINTSNQYMDQEKADDDTGDDVVMGGDEELDEKATSKAQRRAAAIAMHAPKSKLQGASKEMSKMPKKELEKFAGTKEKGLPNKKEKTQETTSSGSVATSTAAPKAGKGGVQFGKGIYESLDRQLKQQLNEEMSINMSIGTDGRKSITVTASDEDADQLAQILNLAGLQGQSHDHGAEVVDENAPDYPQNMGQTSDTNFMTKTNAGGLNKEKYTGQSTIPVLASQGDRQHAYENVELERSLFKLYQEVKSK